MKTFEDELRELLLWHRDNLIEANKIPFEGCLDGGGTELFRKARREYRKRLDALKAKYNRQ